VSPLAVHPAAQRKTTCSGRNWRPLAARAIHSWYAQENVDAACLSIVMRLAVLSCLLMTTLGAKRLPVRTYTVADGLPRNTITCIVRDSRGFLWFCTPSGLSRFDGYQFTSYGQDEGLVHPHVNAILETSSGSYWVATSGGLCRFMPQVSTTSKSRFTCYSTGETHSDALVNAIVEGPRGKIWAGTNGGLYRFSEPADVRTPPKLDFIDLGIPLVSGRRVVTSLLEDRHGTLWVGTEYSGLYRHWADGYTARCLPANRILSLAEDPDGSIWVGRWSGIAQVFLGSGSLAELESKVVRRERRNGERGCWAGAVFEGRPVMGGNRIGASWPGPGNPRGRPVRYLDHGARPQQR
jgi:ligand-binding sensor domain-containing protein